MKSLVACIKKAGKGIKPEEAAFLKSARKEYLDAGKSNTDATHAAITDFMDQLNDESNSLAIEIESLGGSIPSENLVRLDAKAEIATIKKIADAKAKKIADAKAKKIADAKAKKLTIQKQEKTDAEKHAAKEQIFYDKLKAAIAKKDALTAAKKKKLAEYEQQLNEPTQVGQTHDNVFEQEPESPLELSLASDPIKTVMQKMHARTENPLYKSVIDAILNHIPSNAKIKLVNHNDKLPAFVVNATVKTKLGDVVGGNLIESLGMMTLDNTTGEMIIYIKDPSFIEHGTTDETVLHEVLHGAVVELIQTVVRAQADPKLNQNLPPDLVAGVEQIQLLQAHLELDLLKKIKNGTATRFERSANAMEQISDIQEFVTWGLTNKHFVQYLKSVRYGKTNVWTRFISSIAKILGLKEHNALLELLDATTIILKNDFRDDAVLRKEMSGNTGGKVISFRQEITNPKRSLQSSEQLKADFLPDPQIEMSALEKALQLRVSGKDVAKADTPFNSQIRQVLAVLKVVDPQLKLIDQLFKTVSKGDQASINTFMLGVLDLAKSKGVSFEAVDKAFNALEAEVTNEQQNANKRTEQPGADKSKLGHEGTANPKSDGAAQLYTKSSDTGNKSLRGVVNTFKPSDALVEAAKVSGYPTETFNELDSSLSSVKKFSDAISKSAKTSKFGAAVFVYPNSDYKGMRLFLSPDGLKGFAVKPDGDIVSVFTQGGGYAHHMLGLAVEQGGTKLDAFDTVLPDIYSEAGFVETSRDLWDEQYRPDGWDKKTFGLYNNGEPAIIYMTHESQLQKNASSVTAQKQVKQRIEDDIPSQQPKNERTTSFRTSSNTIERTFEIANLEEKLASVEYRRANRLDIKAGRETKLITSQITTLRQSIETDRKKDPKFNDDLGVFEDAVGKIIPRSKSSMTLYERFKEWAAEHVMSPKEIGNTLGRRLVSDIWAIEQMEIDKNGKRLDGVESATVLAAEAKNSHEAASVIIHQYGLKYEDKQLVIDRTQLGLEQILEPVAALGPEYLRWWQAYIVVKRSERLMQEDKENYILDHEIQAIKDTIESKPNLKTLFESTQAEYMKLNRSVLQIAIDSGWINQEDAFGGYVVTNYSNLDDPLIFQEDGTLFPADTDFNVQFPESDGYGTIWQDGWAHDDYVPYNRINELNGRSNARGSVGKIGQVRKGVIGLKGGIGQIPVLENMVKNITFLVGGAMKTTAMQSTVDMALDSAIESIHLNGEAPLINRENAKAIQNTLGVDFNSMSVAERMRWKRMLSASMPMSDDTVVVYNNGRATYYTVTDPALLGALKSLGPKQVGKLLHVIGFPTRLLSATITKMPSFIIKNLVREIQNIYAINEHGSVNPLTVIGKGLKNFGKLLKKDNPEMMAMMATGAVSFNSYFKTAPADVAHRLNKMGVKKSALRKIVEAPFVSATTFWDFYIRIAAATEHANRLSIRDDYIKAETKKLNSEGLDPDSASYTKKLHNITAEGNYRGLDVLNFSRRGDGLVADVMMATMPFINPRIQGLDRLRRGYKENKKSMAIKAGMMTAASLMLATWNWDNNEEEMDALKEEDKDLWYHFFIENSDGTKDHYRFPKGFEVGQITGTLPERILEQFKTEQPEPVWNSFKRFLSVTFGLSAPQVIRPMLEVSANEDFFRQRPILNFGQQFAPPNLQQDVWTSKLIIDIAQAMPDIAPDWAKSPKKLEHLFKGYLGTMGALVLEGTNDMYSMTGNAPDAPTKSYQQEYLIRDFIRSGSVRSSRHINRVYDMLTDVGEISAGLKMAKDNGNLEQFRRLKVDNIEKLRIRKRLNKISKNLRALNKRVKAILADKVMDGDTKFKKIQSLQVRKNELAKEATDKYWYIFN